MIKFNSNLFKIATLSEQMLKLGVETRWNMYNKM